MTARRLLGSLLVVAALAGCGDRAAIEEGGRVPGDVLTVYVLGAPPAFVRGAKVALAAAGGQAGRFTVQFATKALPADPEGMADAVEEVVRDVATIAVIGRFDAEQARVTAPLLNAVGLLEVSAGAAPAEVAQPAGRPSFFALDGADGRQTMDAVLDALRRAGDDAPRRSAVIEAFAVR